MKKVFIIMLSILFLVNSPFAAQNIKDWTVFIYFAADNGEGEDLEGDGWIDLAEIMEAKVDSSNINIVIEADFGSKGYDGRYIIKDGKLERLSSYEEINLGDAATLERFLREGTADFPAEKYMLEFWGHGTGMISMAGPGTIIEDLQSQQNRNSADITGATSMRFDYVDYTDEISPDIAIARKAAVEFMSEYNVSPKLPSRVIGYDESHHDSLTLLELKKVFDRLGIKFNLLSFDACLMNTVEVNFQLEDYADYIVSAITTFPGGGYWYTGWMKYLSEHPGVEGYGLAKAILASNKDFYNNEEKFVTNFVLTVKERIKKNLRGQKEAVLQAMAENNIPEAQFEEFVDMYAGNYVNENIDGIIENGKKAFPMQTLNFGMINTSHVDDVVNNLEVMLSNLNDELNVQAFVKAREKASNFNPAFGDQYGHFYMDTVTFAKEIAKNSSEDMKKACDNFVQLVYKAESYRIVIHGDKELEKNRMSILFPENIKLYGLLHKYYAPLEFSKVSSWDDILAALSNSAK
jgi:hypothetical protein